VFVPYFPQDKGAFPVGSEEGDQRSLNILPNLWQNSNHLRQPRSVAAVSTLSNVFVLTKEVA
jgi:hypothetical protein